MEEKTIGNDHRGDLGQGRRRQDHDRGRVRHRPRPAGKKTAVIDFDVGLRNLDLIMGCERRVVYDLIDVINGDAKLNQALIKDKRVDALHMLPTSQTRDKDALKRDGVERIMKELKKTFDYVVCDSPAGIEHGAQTALYFADEAIVVTNPEVSSVRDSDRMVGILASKSRRAERDEEPVKSQVLITRYDAARVERGEMLKVEDVVEMLALPLLGVIPESELVLQASNVGAPVVLDAKSKAGQAYRDAVARYLGEQLEFRLSARRSAGFVRLRVRQPAVAEERVSIFQRHLRGRGRPAVRLLPRADATLGGHRQGAAADRCSRSSAAAARGRISCPSCRTTSSGDPQVRRDRQRQGLDRGRARAPGLGPRHQHRAAAPEGARLQAA